MAGAALAVSWSLGVCLALSGDRASAQTPFTGVFTFGGNGNVSSFAYNGSPILNLTVGNLTKNGVTTSSSSGNFRASDWPLDNTPVGGLTGSIDPTKYFEFTLTASPGYTFDIGSLNFGAGRSSTGPRSFVWRSSIDNYAATIPSYSSLGASGLITNSSGTLTITDTTATTGTNVVLALSGSSSSYQGLSTISLRFYAFNSEAVAGTFGLQGPLTFAGSLTGSGGASYAWSGGAGTWENGQGGNFGQAFANSPTSTATFGGSGGVVTVSGTVETASITVDSPGYSFEGGTVSLANATVTVNADSTSIASVLTGSAGLVKSGTGSLSLSGVNTYVGLTNLTGGRLVIASDAALGDAANDLAIAGTLATTANVSLGAGRDLSGPATLDIAPGTILTVGGSSGLSATTLVNTGTLDLQGATGRGVGALAFNAAATLTASGTISASSVTASGLASGTAAVMQPISFASTGTKNVVVTGGELVLAGEVSGMGTGYLTKTGSGTLRVGGPIAAGGIQIGFTSSSPSAGGVVVLEENGSAGNQQLRLNYGTLIVDPLGGLTISSGVSVGGRDGAVAVIGGAGPLVVSGTTNFFRGTGTAGELRLDVDNETTLQGPFTATSGGGTATGITVGGTGRLSIAGDAAAIVDALTLRDALDLIVNGTYGGAVTVGGNNLLGGGGAILGSLTLNAGADLLFDPVKALTVNGATVSFGGFGIADLIGFSAAIPDGSYTLIDGSAVINTANLANLGAANAVDLGGGRSAYFETGSLVLQVVPEPSAIALAGLGVAAAAWAAWRRRINGSHVKL